jgi:hypothetical protein
MPISAFFPALILETVDHTLCVDSTGNPHERHSGWYLHWSVDCLANPVLFLPLGEWACVEVSSGCRPKQDRHFLQQCGASEPYNNPSACATLLDCVLPVLCALCALCFPVSDRALFFNGTSNLAHARFHGGNFRGIPVVSSGCLPRF